VVENKLFMFFAFCRKICYKLGESYFMINSGLRPGGPLKMNSQSWANSR
jgi:hypothetical protein